MLNETKNQSDQPIKLEALSIGGLDIEIAMIEDEMWVYAPNLAEILGYRDSRDMLRGDDEERRKLSVKTVGGVQTATLLSEPHFYRIVLRSRSDAAERFKQWLFKEALPDYNKSDRARMHLAAFRLGVRIELTEAQWEWLGHNPQLVDILPLALAGYDATKISQMLDYKTKATGVTARKQIQRLKELGFLPQVIEPRIKQLERKIKLDMATKLAE